jgi:tetratricopeptide (TPR) repeat protein
MGGPATFAGTNYQAATIAYVFVHMLAHRRLEWLTPIDDTPLAVSAETGGPRDDVAIEFGEGRRFEVQAKAGLIGPAALTETVRGIAARAGDNDVVVVLVVDRRSSGWIFRDFATELERIRGGRLDVLPTAGALYAELGAALNWIRVKAIDVSPPDDPEAQRAKDLLARVLVDPDQAEIAWALLLVSASDVAARRLRKDRAAVIDLLVARGVAVQPLSVDELWIAQLDFVKSLLERGHASSALSVLSRLEAEIQNQAVGSQVRYWLARHRATALLRLGRNSDALASALQALEIKPNGPDALVSAAVAQLQLGDLPNARRYADAAVSAGPENAKAWGALAQVKSAAGEGLPEPPPAVASSTHYLTVLAEGAIIRGDIDRTLELTQLILGSGERSPEALILRASALLEAGRDAATAEVRSSAEAERLATEAIDLLDDVHPLKPKALVLRAAARRAAGRPDEADADLRLGSTLDPDDADVARNLVSLRMAAGDDDGALELLTRPVANSDALLVAVRAEVLARQGRREEAAGDIEHGLTLVPDYHDPDAARLALANAALELDDAETAAGILEGLGEAVRNQPIAAVFAGRIAFARGDIEEGVRCYRRGADLAGGQRDAYLVELAVNLVRSRQFAGAVAVFDERGGSAMPNEGWRAYVFALMRTNALARAQDQVDAMALSGPLPAWAIAVAVDIALAREDPDQAIARLTELVDRGEATPHVRIVLAQLLIEADRRDDASTQVEAAIASPTTTTEERMQIAELLRELGRSGDAVDQAFTAFREAPDDPRMHRALVGMVFASRIDIPPSDMSGPDTHIRLSGEHGEVREHTILAEPPRHLAQDEISPEDAGHLGLLGKRIGNVVIEHEGTWQQKRWSVVEIVPAVVFYARDALAKYEQRFPGEPFFATAVHVGDGSAPGDFAGILQALGERRAHVDQSMALLRDQILPLGMFVRLLGGSMADLMDTLMSVPEQAAPLWVEWDDAPLQAWSLEQARTAKEVVICRSALKTTFDLQFADQLVQGYDLLAPSSLVPELRAEILEARDQVEHGRSTMWSGGAGIRIDDVPAGDERLRERLRRLESILGWLLANVQIEPRPAAWIKPEDSTPTGVRQMIGKSSYDALVLSTHRGTSLFADDLGLRRFALVDERPRSFSSVMLLRVLAERALMSAATRDRLLSTLASRNYLAVPPSPGMLLAALHSDPPLAHADLVRVFASLSRPGVNPAGSAAVIGLICRAVALEPVQVVATEHVAELSLDALGARVPRPLAATLVERAVSETLKLLPRDLEAVRSACARFAGL